MANLENPTADHLTAAAEGLSPLRPIPICDASESAAHLLDEGAVGLKVGVVTEGFGADDGVNERVRNAARRLGERGGSVAEVSVPMHEASMAIFLPIVVGGFLHDVVHRGGVGTGRAGHQAVDDVDAHQNMSTLLQEAPANVLMLTHLGDYVRSVAGPRPVPASPDSTTETPRPTHQEAPNDE